MTAEPVHGSSPDDEHGQEQPSVRSLVDQYLKLGRVSPELEAELEAELARRLEGRPAELGHLKVAGKARKVSVSMPEDLTAAVQQRVGRGEFSQYVTEAVARQLELDLLGELAALLETEHGPVSDEALAEARHAWPSGE